MISVTIREKDDCEVYPFDNTVTVESSTAVTVDDVLDVICQALMGLGFHPDSVADGIISKADELMDMDHRKRKNDDHNNNQL